MEKSEKKEAAGPEWKGRRDINDDMNPNRTSTHRLIRRGPTIYSYTFNSAHCYCRNADTHRFSRSLRVEIKHCAFLWNFEATKKVNLYKMYVTAGCFVFGNNVMKVRHRRWVFGWAMRRRCCVRRRTRGLYPETIGWCRARCAWRAMRSVLRSAKRIYG